MTQDPDKAHWNGFDTVPPANKPIVGPPGEYAEDRDEANRLRSFSMQGEARSKATQVALYATSDERYLSVDVDDRRNTVALGADDFDDFLMHALELHGEGDEDTKLIFAIASARNVAIAAQVLANAASAGKDRILPYQLLRSALANFTIESRAILAKIAPEPKIAGVSERAYPEPSLVRKDLADREPHRGGGFWKSTDTGRVHVDYSADESRFSIELHPTAWETMVMLSPRQFEEFVQDAQGLLSRSLPPRTAPPEPLPSKALATGPYHANGTTRLAYDPEDETWTFTDWSGDNLQVTGFNPNCAQFSTSQYSDDRTWVQLGNTDQMRDLIALLQSYVDGETLGAIERPLGAIERPRVRKGPEGR